VGGAAPAFLAEEGSSGRSAQSGGRPARRLAAVRDAAPSEPAADVLTVLLVEDDAAMQLVVSVNLEAAGFRVVPATTGGEAVALAGSARPDVVLLDVMLPDLGGFEVAERLAGLPIVFMSARVSATDLERGRQLGAIDYVTKPFDPLLLPARLREDLEELKRRGRADRVWELRFGPPTGG